MTIQISWIENSSTIIAFQIFICCQWWWFFLLLYGSLCFWTYLSSFALSIFVLCERITYISTRYLKRKSKGHMILEQAWLLTGLLFLSSHNWTRTVLYNQKFELYSVQEKCASERVLQTLRLAADWKFEFRSHVIIKEKMTQKF